MIALGGRSIRGKTRFPLIPHPIVAGVQRSCISLPAPKLRNIYDKLRIDNSPHSVAISL